MFPKYGGTKALMAALDHHYHPCTSRGHVIDREVLALSSENIYGQEKLCSKNPAHDCRGRQVERGSHTKSRGQGRNGRCDRCRRSCRRSGHEFAEPPRKYRTRTKDGREKAGA
jgi:hypothetical protein